MTRTRHGFQIVVYLKKTLKFASPVVTAIYKPIATLTQQGNIMQKIVQHHLPSSIGAAAVICVKITIEVKNQFYKNYIC